MTSIKAYLPIPLKITSFLQFFSEHEVDKMTILITEGSGQKLREFLDIIALENDVNNKQLLDEVEHDIMSYQNRGLCYLPKPKA